VTAQDFVNAVGGKILVNGDSGISASGNFNNYGTFELGAGNRSSIGGNYSQASGASFVLDVGGDNFSVGSLSVGGTASLGGAMIVDRLAGLKVATGDSASVITAKAISGRFKPVSGLSSGHTVLQVSYSPTTVTLAPPKGA
jgi:outer membrane autotransporter protein